MGKRIALFWFSGTGNTRHAAFLLERELRARGVAVDMKDMAGFVKASTQFDAGAYDLVGFAHPVHGFGVPRIVYQCIRLLPHGAQKQSFILKTAAGRHGMNRGASRTLITALRKRGYAVFYDRAYMMPSNWLYSLPAPFNKQICGVLEAKIAHTAADLLSLNRREIPCSAILGFVTNLLWHSEDFGARFFGKDLHAGKTCNRCGRCARECPTGNITERNGKIRFGWSCVWCMHCIYSCPVKAISPRIEKFLVLKQGYDLQKLLRDETIPADYVKSDSTGSFSRHTEYLFDPAQ